MYTSALSFEAGKKRRTQLGQASGIWRRLFLRWRSRAWSRFYLRAQSGCKLVSDWTAGGVTALNWRTALHLAFDRCDAVAGFLQSRCLANVRICAHWRRNCRDWPAAISKLASLKESKDAQRLLSLSPVWHSCCQQPPIVCAACAVGRQCKRQGKCTETDCGPGARLFKQSARHSDD